MTLVKDLQQKLKGKGQMLKGELQSSTGHEGRGTINKLRGKTNDTVATLKLRSRRRTAAA